MAYRFVLIMCSVSSSFFSSLGFMLFLLSFGPVGPAFPLLFCALLGYDGGLARWSQHEDTPPVVIPTWEPKVDGDRVASGQLLDDVVGVQVEAKAF